MREEKGHFFYQWLSRPITWLAWCDNMKCLSISISRLANFALDFVDFALRTCSLSSALLSYAKVKVDRKLPGANFFNDTVEM